MVRFVHAMTALALLAGSAGPAPSAELPETRLFSIGNLEAVTQPPANPSVFANAVPWRVTSLSTYHWNGANGDAPGTIWLTEAGGSNFGPWQTVGRNGMGGVLNAYWDAVVDVMLPPGTYTVNDSHPATWSQNNASGNRGFVEVRGHRQIPDLPAAGAITGIVYAVDGDPRVAPVFCAVAAPGSQVETQIVIAASSVTGGWHRLTFCALGDGWGEPGPFLNASILRTPPSPETVGALAMAVNADPAQGGGTEVIVNPPAPEAERLVTLPAGSVPDGPQRLMFRARDGSGNWGPLCVAPALGEQTDPAGSPGPVAAFEMLVLDAAGTILRGPRDAILSPPPAVHDGPVVWPQFCVRTSGVYTVCIAAVATNGLPGPEVLTAFQHEVSPFQDYMHCSHWPPEDFPGLNLTFCGDVNHDGVANGLAFALGLDVAEQAASFVPTPACDNDYIYLTFRQRAGGSGTPGNGYVADGIRYDVEVSETLLGGSWVTGIAEPAGAPQSNADGTETVTVRIPRAAFPDDLFARLRCQAQP